MSHRFSVSRYTSLLLALFLPLFFTIFTHTAFADTLPNPLNIRNDATGGDCSLVGTWNAGAKTCTINQDLTQAIEVSNSGYLPYTADNITIDGANHTLTGQDVGRGIHLDKVNNTTIKNITIEHFAIGIFIESANQDSIVNGTTVVQNVTIRNTPDALSESYSHRTHYSDITIDSARTVLSTYVSSGLIMEDVNATNIHGGIPGLGGNYVGIVLREAVNPVLSNITMSGDTDPLIIWNTKHATLRNVHITGFPIDLSRVDGTQHGTFFQLEGVVSEDYNHDIDESNTINSKPIKYWYNISNASLDASGAFVVVCVLCSNVEIGGADIKNTYYGMYIYDTKDVTIANSTIMYTAAALSIASSTRVTVEKNIFTQNSLGLQLRQTDDSHVKNNTFEDIQSQAVVLNTSNNNTITGNTLRRNYVYLTYDQLSGGNRFYRNSMDAPLHTTFGIMISDDSGQNTYSLPLPYGGNYWSTYDQGSEGCNDTNNDHMCDAPYSIPNVTYNAPAISDTHPWNSPIVARCKDGIDNDGDGKTDTADSGCHTDFDASNAASYDPLIDNEDFMTSQYYTPLQDVTAQPTYATTTPQGTAPNVIVLVHGCCTSNDDVESSTSTWGMLKSAIEQDIVQNAVAGPWEVLVWNWSDGTPKDSNLGALIADGYVAYINAFEQGNVLGERIRSGHYKYVHFVGHSAGSNLIDSAVRDIKTAGGTNQPIIHMTFLDAFAPFGSKKTYGGALKDADFAEQYVLTGDLPQTSATLPHAYNFDVTGISPAGLDSIQAHSWPIEFYRQSSINAGTYGFGLPLSFERSNQGTSSTFYANEKQSLLNQKHISVGDVCLLTSTTACTANPFPIFQQTIDLKPLSTSTIIGGINSIKKSLTGVVNVFLTELLVGQPPTSINVVLNTGSPVWFEIPLATTESYNILTFDYEFLSAAGAEGIMTVFVDDNPVYKIDERLAAGTTTTPNIPIGDLAPGQHRIGFRLDPFTDVQSSARVSNIQLGLLTENVGDTVPPTVPTALTAVPLSTSTIRLSWATSTDNIGVSGYHIFRATSSSATTTLIATTTASITTYTNAGLVASTTYWYQIKAVDLAGNVSSSSSKVSTTTLKTAVPIATTYHLTTGTTTPYTDPTGTLWQGDQYFVGGTMASRGAIAINNTLNDRLYQSERYGMTGYAIPVPNGTYQVTLHFAETSPTITAAGQRTFTVALEGTTILTNLDVFKEAGKNTALIKTFTTSVTDGTLNLTFTKVVNAPEINGIEVIPADTTPPSTPTNLTAVAASSTQINLTWATSTDAVGYQLERCSGATCTTFTQIATTTVPNYKNTGLTASTTYRFRVRAIDLAGNRSTYSTTTTITTPKAPQTIFQDTFESALNWTKTGAVTWYTGTPKVGTHAVKLTTTASIEKAVSLQNYQNITVSFRMGANSLDTSSENVQALYYNGSAWVTLTTIANNSTNENNQLNPYTFTLPATMNNKTTFKLRFKINGSATDDAAFVDEVKVVGVRM